MNINELYLKTAFACMACDGEIATEEIALVKHWTTNNSHLFGDLDVESTLNAYIAEINQQGKAFLSFYISELATANLTEAEQLQLLTIAIEMIEADNKIEYSEIAFFKKMRFKLPISDAAILAKFPDKERFLLPDIIEPDDWNFPQKFDNIKL